MAGIEVAFSIGKTKKENDIATIIQSLQSKFNVEEKRVFDISTHNGAPICSIFIDDGYIQFHDEFVQTAPLLEEFNWLMPFLEESGWHSNVD